MKGNTAAFKNTLITVCLALCTLAVAAAQGLEPPRGRFYGMVERIERVEYSERAPIRAAYDWGRLAATRWLVGFGLEPDAFWYGGGVAGLGVNEVHSGEGETVDYDAVFLGLEGAYRRSLTRMPGVGFRATARFLIALPDDGEITDVARDSVTDGARAELSWNELTLGVAALLDYDAMRFETGLEYCSRDISQKWTFPDASRNTSRSTLTPDRDLGVRLGVALLISEGVEARLGMTVGHQTAFRGGVQVFF